MKKHSFISVLIALILSVQVLGVSSFAAKTQENEPKSTIAASDKKTTEKKSTEKDTTDKKSADKDTTEKKSADSESKKSDDEKTEKKTSDKTDDSKTKDTKTDHITNTTRIKISTINMIFHGFGVFSHPGALHIDFSMQSAH